jgi:chloramphenicol 3-O-phosphotransferase
VVPVLMVIGPVGVGKSAVLHEADVLLVSAGVRQATLELEEIARFWPDERGVPSSDRLVFRNLAAIWSNFAADGAERLLLAGLIEQRSELSHVAKAVPGAAVTVVRLHASLSVLEERIRRREPDPEGELSAARWWWAKHLDRSRLEDHLVQTDRRPLREVAGEVSRVGGWLT